MHHKGIQSKVHPRDLICISENYKAFRKCLVVIDRERGRTRLVPLSLKDRGKMLAEVWVKGAFTIGRGNSSELLAFLLGYFAASGIPRSDNGMRENIVQSVVVRAKDILAHDERFSSLRQDFKEMYGIPGKYSGSGSTALATVDTLLSRIDLFPRLAGGIWLREKR